MFKTISAALLAASILSVPAMATTVIKTNRGHVAKVVTVKPVAAHSHAKMVVVKKKARPHRVHKRSHRHAKKVVVIKKHHHHR